MLPLINVHNLKEGDTGLSASQMNAIFDAVKKMYTNWILTGPMRGAVINGQQAIGQATRDFEPQLGIIVPQGPLLQPDFTGIKGHQYWVKTARITNGDDPALSPANPDNPPNDPAGLAEHGICDIRVRAINTRVRHIQVENIAEINTRGHLLPNDGTHVVLIYRAENARGITRWFMDSTPPSFVWVRVGPAASIGPNVWKYTCYEQERDSLGWNDKPGGRTFSDVLNGFETNNGADPSIRGNGVNSGGASYPTGFDLQPIRGNPVVRLTPTFIPGEPEVPGNPPIPAVPASVAWSFSHPNSDDGTCT